MSKPRPSTQLSIQPSARTVALDTLRSVLFDGQSLEPVFAKTAEGLADPRDISLASELVYGTLRFLPQLEASAKQLLRQPLRNRDSDVRIVLLLGLYQLIHTRIPVHAAISESVALLTGTKIPWAKGVVNACLRSFERQYKKPHHVAIANHTLATHPEWMVKSIRTDWPLLHEQILKANDQRAPMTLRVNTQKLSRDAYLEQMQRAGIAAIPCRHSPVGITLERPQPTHTLPGFSSGWISVQDEAAQLALQFLEINPELNVLDACAAPGGKTAHMLETFPSLNVCALDRNETKITHMNAELERLGCTPVGVVADTSQLGNWWNKQPFDRVLLDVPCSASGVIRRHPDIKYHRQPGDLDRICAQQRALLNTSWKVLARGGMLLYVTCSVFAAENADQITHFLNHQSDATPVPIRHQSGINMTQGLQILPGTDGMDGFFYALLQKK